MKKFHTGIVAIVLTVCILGLCGCSDIRAQNLMKGKLNISVEPAAPAKKSGKKAK